MLIVPVEDAQVGMTLAAPVTHPDHPDQDLLKAGYVLESDVLARVRSLGISYLHVDYPGLDDLDRHLAVNLSPARQQIYKLVKNTIVAGQKRTQLAVSYGDYYSTTRDLITTLLDQGQHPVYLENMSRMGGDAVSHATAVAHLSLLLGIKLETYLISQRHRLPAHHAKEVVNLGVAGMLHDMGKLALPEELRKHSVLEQPQDVDQNHRWREHAREGYEMVRGGIEPSAAAAVLHHHQRWDGLGFPITKHTDGSQSCPSQNRIHIFSRIIAAADLYDRLCTPNGNAHRRPNIYVLHLMQTQYASWCDPAVLRMLQAVAPPFPPGSVISLSDGSSAVVVDVNHADPYRPIVKRMNAAGDVEATRIDLSKPGAPQITHVGKTDVREVLNPAA